MLGKTLGELNMSWREFLLWQEYLRLEPPDHGDNLRTATLMAHIANMSGKTMKKGSSMTPEDFMGGKKQQTMQEQIAFLKGIGNG